MYKEFSKIINKKTAKLKKIKWANDLNTHFTKEDTQMAIKPMKRCSTSLVIGEMQIKIIVRYLYTPLEMAKIKETQTDNTKFW